MGQYQARTKSIDEEQAPGTTERGPTDGAPPPVFGSPIDSRSQVFDDHFVSQSQVFVVVYIVYPVQVIVSLGHRCLLL